jgi:diacylglycerol kinase (ATP)
MRVMVLYNPIAGAGRAARVARSLREPLAGAGHDVSLMETRTDPPASWLLPALAGVDLLVVAGGDGAMRLAGGPAADSATPVYHFPVGTENLFSREFGMDRSVPRLLRAIGRRETRVVDVGRVGEETFLLMISVGFDADVVIDLASRRKGGITHLSYVGPIVRQMLRWRPPRLTIDVDGTRLVDDRPGFVVVANARQYARRLDPARNASMTDGLLDVAFFPTAGVRSLPRWALACRLGRQMNDPRLVSGRGRAVVLRSDPPRWYQIDGDAPEGLDRDPPAELAISLSNNGLPVLIP